MQFHFFQKLKTVIFLLAVALSGCGGGGGGGSSITVTYDRTSDACTGTEDACQAGISIHNVGSLNTDGHTGSGINVAVVDSGIDATHPEFDGKTINGVDFASSPTSFGRDENGHGTHVASIIAADDDGSGMQGIAYDANLYSYKVDSDGDSDFEGLSGEANKVSVFNQHVTDNIKVSNNSWSSGSYEINEVNETFIRNRHSNSITAMRNAQTNGTLFVFAAGNYGETGGSGQYGSPHPDYFGAMPYYITELENEWLVVMSVNENLQETVYTKRCGLAWEICVAAVGGGDNVQSDGVYAAASRQGPTSNQGDYVRLSGTSMAAPQVSGIAAVLMDKFPALTPAQIATRIKNTTTYNGLYDSSGNLATSLSVADRRAIFGNGLVNGAAAGAMIGESVFPIDDNINKGVTSLSSNPLSIPGWIPVGTAQAIMQTKLTVFDSFDGAGFAATGKDVFTHRQNRRRTQPLSAFLSGQSTRSAHDNLIDFNRSENGHSLSFYRTEAFNQPEKSFWGDTLSLFSTQSTFSGEQDLGLLFSTQSGYGQLNTYADISRDGDGFGIGASYMMTSPTMATKALIGASNTKSTVNTSMMWANNRTVTSQVIRLGLIQPFSERLAGFYRATHRDISDLHHSPHEWGMSGAKERHQAMGLEYNDEGRNIVFGIQEPEELKGGIITFYTPEGRERNGDIRWSRHDLALDSDRRYSFFAGVRIPVSDHAVLDMHIHEDDYNSGSLGDVKLGLSVQF